MGVRMSRALPYRVRSIQFLLLFFGVVALAGCLREKDRLDAQVREMCAKDGGMKVYEQVRVPVDRFNDFGQIRVPFKSVAKVIDEYFYESETVYFRKGNPSMRRSNVKLIRSDDLKVLGEVVSYHRVGGDFPGPWHESSQSCPENVNEVELAKLIFMKNK